LAWQDEFDGPNLDTTKWTIVSDAPGGFRHCCLNNTLNAWAANDVSIIGGNLRLTTERRDFQGHAYTSGAVTTQGKFDSSTDASILALAYQGAMACGRPSGSCRPT
jgi:beta-glucanase (GH16 family)